MIQYNMTKSLEISMTKIIKLILKSNSRNGIILIIWLAISMTIVHLQDAIIVLVIFMIMMMTLILANKNTVNGTSVRISKKRKNERIEGVDYHELGVPRSDLILVNSMETLELLILDNPPLQFFHFFFFLDRKSVV